VGWAVQGLEWKDYDNEGAELFPFPTSKQLMRKYEKDYGGFLFFEGLFFFFCEAPPSV